ncbi:MAG: DUF4091 domain-containing protein [Clostridiaceae bacterium]|nr:DUF4091 domain-containing protein [Clostridiaceae bacterium]
MNFVYGLIDESYKCAYGTDGAAGNSEAFENKDLSLVCAKNSFAAFQVCLKADEPFIVSTGGNPVFSPKGPYNIVRLECCIKDLPGANINMFPELYMEDDDGILKADILSAQEYIEVNPGMTQPVWVEITLPADMEAGTYTGQVNLYIHKMFQDEKRLNPLTFTLEVKDVTLPNPVEYKFYLDLWQHPSNISRKHEVRLWSDEHFDVLEKYIESLAALGQKAATVIISEIPWSGQFCTKTVNYPSDLFEYSMVKVIKDESGNYEYDYSSLKRYLDLCFKYGIDREIEVFGLFNIWVNEQEGYGGIAPDYPDAIRIRYYDKKDRTYKYMKSGEEIKEYIKALERYFIEESLIDRVRICADEPADMELFLKRLNLLKKTAPAFKYKAAINHYEFVETVSEIEDCVFSLNCVMKEPARLRDIRRETAGRLLYYVCCGPKVPNTFLASNLVESQFLGILAGILELDGFLRWNYTVWPENPRQRIRYKYPYWPAGDTNFVYPGNNGAPLLTLRYKNLKRGIEFYELIRLVIERGGNYETVKELIKKRLIKTDDLKDFLPERKKEAEEIFSVDYNDYREVYRLLLDECIL